LIFKRENEEELDETVPFSDALLLKDTRIDV